MNLEQIRIYLNYILPDIIRNKIFTFIDYLANNLWWIFIISTILIVHFFYHFSLAFLHIFLFYLHLILQYLHNSPLTISVFPNTSSLFFHISGIVWLIFSPSKSPSMMKLNIWGALIELGEYGLSVYLILISLLNLFPDIIDTVFDVYIQLYPLQIFYNDIYIANVGYVLNIVNQRSRKNGR